jgi:hypothetical protein
MYSKIKEMQESYENKRMHEPASEKFIHAMLEDATQRRGNRLEAGR